MADKPIVVVESGATKSDWRVLSGNGCELWRFSRPGMNVSTMQMDTVKDVLEEGIVSEGLREMAGFYIYTAGVVTPEIAGELKDHVLSLSGVDDFDIQNDLMGAARGVCGHNPGIVAIMGTGSNTCFYDGKSLSQKVYSGGYVIGDDGSGAALGKLFLSDFIKGLVPPSIAEDFSREFDSSYSGIVQGVYRSPSPSGYLGSIAPLIVRHYGDDPYAKALVDRNFKAFIERSLLKYDTRSFPVGIVGGFGWVCKDILAPLLEEAGIRIYRFIKAPIEGLCQYHTA